MDIELEPLSTNVHDSKGPYHKSCSTLDKRPFPDGKVKLNRNKTGRICSLFGVKVALISVIC